MKFIAALFRTVERHFFALAFLIASISGEKEMAAGMLIAAFYFKLDDVLDCLKSKPTIVFNVVDDQKEKKDVVLG